MGGGIHYIIGADSTGATGATAPVLKKVRGPTYILAPVLMENVDYVTYLVFLTYL
jgi:hypothetical protein